MTLEKLEVGMKIANYRKMCELLDEPVKNGASKRAQFNTWQRFFSYDRQGNSYTITAIHDTPELNNDGRISYMRYVEPLLLHYLCQRGGHNSPHGKWIEHTFRDWSVQIGLTSERVYDERVEEEYQVLVSSGVETAKPAFSTLEIRIAKHEIAYLCKRVFLRTVGVLAKKGIIAERSTIYVRADLHARPATPEECSYIETVKNRVKSEMKINGMFAIQISPRKQKEYYERLSKIYRREKGWDKVYELYGIQILESEFVKMYDDINAEKLSAEFKKMAAKSIGEKLNKLVNREEEKLLLEFDQMADGEELEKDRFVMTQISAGAIKHLIEEML